MPDITDFESAKERRINAGIRTGEEYWHNIRDQLVTIMADAELTDAALTSATLNALMAMLEAGEDMTWNEAKGFIATSLKAFEDL